MKKISKIFFGLGTILIILSIFFLINDLNEDKLAGSTSKKVLGIIENDLDNNDNSNKNYVDDTILIDGYNYIGIIEIPSINLSQALVEGISDNVLQYFLGHFPDSAAPGQVGNFAIAGHRVSDYTDAFINLYKVTAGDKIIVKTHDKKYTYVIEENYIVNPDKVEVLDATENATITLITCTVGSKQRVIVKGTLQSTEDL